MSKKDDELRKIIGEILNNEEDIPNEEEMMDNPEKTEVVTIKSPEERLEEIVKGLKVSKTAEKLILDVLYKIRNDRRYMELYTRDDFASHFFDYLNILEVDTKDPFFGSRIDDFDGIPRLIIFSPKPFEECSKADYGYCYSTPMPVGAPNFYYVSLREIIKTDFGIPVTVITACDYFDENLIIPATFGITASDIEAVKSALESKFWGEQLWTIVKNAYQVGVFQAERAEEAMKNADRMANMYAKLWGRGLTPEKKYTLKLFKWFAIGIITMMIIFLIKFLFFP